MSCYFSPLLKWNICTAFGTDVQARDTAKRLIGLALFVVTLDSMFGLCWVPASPVCFWYFFLGDQFNYILLNSINVLANLFGHCIHSVSQPRTMPLCINGANRSKKEIHRKKAQSSLFFREIRKKKRIVKEVGSLKR